MRSIGKFDRSIHQSENLYVYSYRHKKFKLINKKNYTKCLTGRKICRLCPKNTDQTTANLECKTKLKSYQHFRNHLQKLENTIGDICVYAENEKKNLPKSVVLEARGYGKISNFLKMDNFYIYDIQSRQFINIKRTEFGKKYLIKKDSGNTGYMCNYCKNKNCKRILGSTTSLINHIGSIEKKYFCFLLLNQLSQNDDKNIKRLNNFLKEYVNNNLDCSDNSMNNEINFDSFSCSASSSASSSGSSLNELSSLSNFIVSDEDDDSYSYDCTMSTDSTYRTTTSDSNKSIKENRLKNKFMNDKICLNYEETTTSDSNKSIKENRLKNRFMEDKIYLSDEETRTSETTEDEDMIIERNKEFMIKSSKSNKNQKIKTRSNKEYEMNKSQNNFKGINSNIDQVKLNLSLIENLEDRFRNYSDTTNQLLLKLKEDTRLSPLERLLINEQNTFKLMESKNKLNTDNFKNNLSFMRSLKLKTDDLKQLLTENNLLNYKIFDIKLKLEFKIEDLNNKRSIDNLDNDLDNLNENNQTQDQQSSTSKKLKTKFFKYRDSLTEQIETSKSDLLFKNLHLDQSTSQLANSNLIYEFNEQTDMINELNDLNKLNKFVFNKLNKSIDKPKESQSTINKSNELPNKSQPIINKSTDKPKKSQSTINKSNELPNKSQSNINKSIDRPKESESINGKSNELPNKSQSNINKSIDRPKESQSTINKSNELPFNLLPKDLYEELRNKTIDKFIVLDSDSDSDDSLTELIKRS